MALIFAKLNFSVDFVFQFLRVLPVIKLMLQTLLTLLSCFIQTIDWFREKTVDRLFAQFYHSWLQSQDLCELSLSLHNNMWHAKTSPLWLLFFSFSLVFVLGPLEMGCPQVYLENVYFICNQLMQIFNFWNVFDCSVCNKINVNTFFFFKTRLGCCPVLYMCQMKSVAGYPY